MNPQRVGFRTSGNCVILSQNHSYKLSNAKLTYTIVPKKATLVGLTIYDVDKKTTRTATSANSGCVTWRDGSTGTSKCHVIKRKSIK